MFENLRADYAQCGGSTGERIREMLFNTGMWAVVSYRFRRYLYASRTPRVVRYFLAFIGLSIKTLTEVLTNVEIPASVPIGPGLYLPHTGYIVIGSKARLGAHCTLTTGVVIGHGLGGNGQPGDPVIGDRVYIGPGAKVIGPIEIGEDALIGAGAVVIRSVSARGIVAGNPAKPISSKGSFALIKYPGMEQDPGRMRSLAELENTKAGD